MAVSAGTASLQVVPTLTKTFSKDLVTQLTGPATRTANRAGNDAGRTFGKRFGTSARVGLGPVTGIVRGFGGALAGAFAGVAVISGLKSTINAASDLQETLNKNKVVFGTSARSIEQWSKKSATSFGLSRNAALGAAAQFGEMFHQLGFTQQQAAKTSKSLVQTAADLGSFHNVDPSDVLDRISAALRGEYDSLQQLIPNINAARVEQEALRATHKSSVKEITAAEKATAVLAIVQRDGANAAGDFAKTSDNAANRQRILAARLEDVKAAIGKSLLPAWNALLGLLIEKVAPALDGVAQWLSVKIPQAVAVLSEALKAVKVWWDKNKTAVKLLAEALAGFYTPAVSDATGATKDMSSTAEQFLAIIKSVMGAVLRATQVWLFFERGIEQIVSAWASVVIGAGHVLNAFARLKGGSTKTGDAFVKFGQDLKNQTRRELAAIATQSATTQRAIDRLHGKDINITGTTSLNFTKTFTQKDWLNARLAAGRQATGGPVGRNPSNVGFAGGRDTELRWLDPTEHVWTGREVAAAGGHRAMERWRKAVLAGQVPGMAKGGPVLPAGITQTGTAHTGVGKMMDRWGTLIQAAGIRKAMEFGGGLLGGGSGPGGWQWQMRVLRSAFPGLQLISGYRPGAITATGNRSYHGFGRAVDVPPRMDVFNWIRGNYGKNTKELIFSPAGGRQVHNGQPHYYTGITRQNHWGHVHWAYDKGGWLPPGTSLATNNTGRPERVLSPDELVPAGQGVVQVTVDLRGATLLGGASEIATRLAPELRKQIRDAQRRGGIPAREQLR